MDHDSLKSKLYEFYDGELSKDETQVFSKHLASCQECQSEIALLTKAAQTFFKKPEIKISSAFSERVMSEILQRNERAQKTAGGEALSSFRKRISMLDLFYLPRWEVATALSLSLFIFSYFSFDYLKSRERTGTNPIALVYNQAGAEPWLFSKQEIARDDLLQMALANSSADEFDAEVEFYE